MIYLEFGERSMKYKLIAENTAGAKIIYRGATMKKVTNDFDRNYDRKGFAIHIEDEENIITRVIKNGYR